MVDSGNIFISYSREDRAWCHVFVETLRQVGTDVWFDEPEGEDVTPSAGRTRALRTRRIFVAVLSPAAVGDSEMWREVDTATRQMREEPINVLFSVVAATRDVPPRWSACTQVSGPNNAGLAPEEAARRVIQALALVPASMEAAPVPPYAGETAEQAWQRSKGLAAQDRQREAVAAAERAISLDPKRAWYWYGKGYALFLLGRNGEALAAHEQALALVPKAGYALRGKGLALIGLDRHREALLVYERALALEPRCVPAWCGKGWALHRMDRYAEALVCFDRSLELDSEREIGWGGRGHVLLSLRRYAEALEAFERTLALDPQWTGCLTGKGLVFAAQGRLEEALAAFEQALEVDAELLQGWLGKIALLDRLGRTAEANEARRHLHLAREGS